MPSPFPGMDPYLEEPGLWPDVHHGLISELQAELNRLLRPRYFARVEERVYISDELDPGRSVIVPDLKIQERPDAPPRRGSSEGTPVGLSEPIVVTTLIDDEIHEPYLKIVDRENRSVVTIVEILSPTNKHPGSYGQRSYREKRHDVMNSPSHFVEIDLLRGGARITIREPLPPCDYLVHISRAEDRPEGRLWPIHLPDRLPAVRIPLRNPEETWLDLQRVLDQTYDRAGYDLEIDYRRNPCRLSLRKQRAGPMSC